MRMLAPGQHRASRLGQTTPAAECFPAACIGGRRHRQAHARTARYKGQECQRRNLARYPSIGTGTMRPEGEKPHVVPGIGGLLAKPPRMAAPTLPRRFPSWHGVSQQWLQACAGASGNSSTVTAPEIATNRCMNSPRIPAALGMPWRRPCSPAPARSLASMVKTRLRPVSSTPPSARPGARNIIFRCSVTPSP